MNKRKIILSLTTMLSVNVLMIGGGIFGDVIPTVYAQESRVTKPGDIQRVDTVDFKKLDTGIKEFDGTTLVLDLKDIDLSKFNVTGELTLNNGQGNNNQTFKIQNENGEVVVKGIQDYGIYSGFITLTDKGDNNNVNTYSLTIKISGEDKLILSGVDVGVATVTIDKAMLGDKDVTSDADNFILRRKGGREEIPGIVGSGRLSGKLVFPKVDLSEGQYEIVYKSEGNKEVIVSLYALEDDTPEITNNIATNNFSNSAEEKEFISNLLRDYGLSGRKQIGLSLRPTTQQNGQHDKEFTVILDGEDGKVGKVVTKYTQTYYGNGTSVDGTRFGGGKLTFDEDTKKLQITGFATSSTSDNFIGVSVASAENKEKRVLSTVIVGDYTAKISYGDTTTTVSYFDATDLFNYSSNGSNVDLNGQAPGNVTFNPITLATLDNLSHGYQTVSVEFNSEDNYSSIISGINSNIGSDGKQITVSSLDSSITNPVKTSLIVANDSLDGLTVNSNFVKTGDHTGNLVLTCSDLSSLLKATKSSSINDLTGKLSVTGGRVIDVKEGQNNTVSFRVEFNSMPNRVDWQLEGISATAETINVETVNLVSVEANNSGTENLENKFNLDVKFNGIVPRANTTIVLKDSRNSVVAVQNSDGSMHVDKSIDGTYTVEAQVKDNSDRILETYTAGLIIDNKGMKLEIDANSNSNNTINVTVDATFFDKNDVDKVTSAKIVYTKIGDPNYKPAEIVISKDNIKEDPVNYSLSVDPGKYDVRAIYNFDGKEVVSNVKQIEVKGSSSVSTGGGSITGDGNPSPISNTSGTITIDSTSSNTMYDGNKVGITLPSGTNYDSNRTPVAAKFSYKDKDGNIVTENKNEYSNVSVKFENGKLIIDGLVPDKDYTEITIEYVDDKGRTRTVVVKNIKTTASTSLEDYLADVYMAVFNRPADEAGYHFHLNNLKNKNVTLRQFLLSLLNEKEFGENYKTPDEKIDGLYAAILARKPDQVGKDFWIEEYKKAVTVYGSEDLALKVIADKMVNEPELKNLAEKMNILW